MEAASAIEFRILGPLEVRRAGGCLPLGGLKQRSLLALLLLHPNQIVSTDRLVHELWGDEPPGTAVTALHGYISQLRKLIEPERAPGAESRVLVTRSPGYVLTVQPGQLDLDRFEESVRRARGELVAGRPELASRELREAFTLWRGSPLADLAGESFAQAAARPMEELWLAALEDRFDADLALGRHREIASELEAVIRSHPLRERLRGQQMLALYRSGRQADALNAYGDARRTLSEELGIEPSAALKQLERDILNQDASLGTPTPEPAAAVPVAARAKRRPTRRVALVVGAAGVVVLAVLSGAFLLTRPDRPGSPQLPTSAVVNLGADGSVARTVAVGSHPTSLAVGAGGLWSLNAGDGTITRFDLRSHDVRTISPGVPLGDIATGRDALWVMNRAGTAVTRVDGHSLATNPPIALPVRGRNALPPGGTSGGQVIAVGGGSVWALASDLRLWRISEATGRVTRIARVEHANTLTYATGALWVATGDATVLRVDARSGRVTRRINVPAAGVAGIAAGSGVVWAADPLDGVLWRIQLGPPRLVMRTIPVGAGAAAVAVGDHAIWVANGAAGTVTRIEPNGMRASTRRLARPPLAVTSAGGATWVSLADAPPPRAHVQETKGSAPVASSCTVVAPAGRAGVVIVSDLPFQGRSRDKALAIDAAIRHVLASRNYRAGRTAVGYQACDDSTEQQGGYEEERCAANARAYAADARVVVVIGSYNSGCSQGEIGWTNQAPGGPLAMVSPASSAAGLTVRTPGEPPGLLAQLYPTGVRSFVRVLPNDIAQAKADVAAARRLGIRRIAILRDPTSGAYGLSLAAAFARAATAAGIRVVLQRTWNPAADDYGSLAARVVAHVDGVFLAGGMTGNSARLLPALRAASSERVRVIVPDGFIAVPELVEAVGPRAPWLLMSVAGVPAKDFSPAGLGVLAALAAKPLGGLPPNRYWPPYGTQAAAAALAAIAHSDGTRSGVRTALFATRMNTAFGPVSFDRNGDIEHAPFTLLRLAPGGEGMSDDGPDFADGTEPVAVVRP